MKSSSLEIRDSLISNLKGFFGAAVIAQDQSMEATDHHLIIDNCTFNRISSTDNGGAIYISNIPAQIMNSKFLSISSLEGNGGAIYLSCSSSLKLKQSK